jgi:GT2 family glycosyltransferase
MVSDAREMTLNGDNQNDIKEQRPFKGAVTYDKLFWIDSDIRWTPEDFMKLYDSDEDIISGAYLLGSGEVTAYKTMLLPAYSFEEVKKMDKPITVEGIGFGFVCIKQGIFESMTRPWFQSAIGTWVDKDTGESFDFPILGEDLSWCKRAGNLGYTITFDPTVRVIHHKTMKLTWEGIQP